MPYSIAAWATGSTTETSRLNEPACSMQCQTAGKRTSLSASAQIMPLVRLIGAQVGEHADAGFDRGELIAAQVTALGNEMRRYFGGLATDVRLPEGVSANSCATVLGSISAGLIVLMAIFGPAAAEDLPATAAPCGPQPTTRSNTQTR
jgi:hypothetical protein